MDNIIVPLTIELYDAVLALWQRCEGIGLSDADSRENMQKYLERNPRMSFVTAVEGCVVGALLAGHDGRRGYLHHLAVHPNYRGHGFARKLVENCLQALTDEGIRKCHVFIFNENTGGIEFWQNIGWTHRSDIGVISKIIKPG